MYKPVHPPSRSPSARQNRAQMENRRRAKNTLYQPVLLWLLLTCALILLIAALPVQAADPMQTVPTATPGPEGRDCRPTLTATQVNQQFGLTGTGMYIWKIANAEGGNPAAIATIARNAGLTFVIIKVADGANPTRIDASSESLALAHPPPAEIGGAVPDVVDNDAERQVVETLQAARIKVWGWHFIRGDDPQGEARQAIQRIQVLGLDGYVIDAEADFKQAGKSQAAQTFMQTLRQSLPDYPLALSTYAYPSAHPEFPIEQFLCQVDLVMPQVYWIGAHNPDEQLSRADTEYKDRAIPRPIVPSGAAFSESGWRPTASEITLFRNTSRSLGQPAVSYWSWDEARSPGNEDLWAAISGRSTWPLYTLDNGWLTSNEVQALAYLNYNKPELLIATAGDMIKIDGRAPQTWPSNLEKALLTRDILATQEYGILLATDSGIWQLASTGIGTQQTQARASVLALNATGGRLWSASEDTLTRYALPFFEIEAQYAAADLGLDAILALEASGERLWIGGESSLAAIDGDQITLLSLPPGLDKATKINALKVTPQGDLWVGSDGGAARWDGETWQAFTPANGLASPVVSDIALDGAGGVWFATQAGAIRYDTEQETWRRYFKSAYPVVPSNAVQAILVDENGTVWLGTDAGVAGLQGQPSVTFVYKHDGRGPASNRITTLLEDSGDGASQEGNLWLGSLDAGLSVRLAGTAGVNGAGGEWRYFDRDTSLLPDNQVTAMLLDTQGQIWVGTPDGAVTCTVDGCQPIQADPALQITDVRMMALDAQGYTWIATGRSLVWCHPGCEAVTSVPGEIILMEATHDGSMWIATSDPSAYICQGLDCNVNNTLFSSQVGQFIRIPQAFLAGEDGGMLVMGEDGQVQHCTQESCSPLPMEPDRRVIGLAYDSFSQLWVLSTQLSEEFPVQAQLHICTLEGCTAQDGIIQADSPLYRLSLAPGPAGEMWVGAGSAGIYYCQTLGECTRTSTRTGEVAIVLAPTGEDLAWIGGQNNGLQRCSPDRCLILPASGDPVPAYEPSPGLPWVNQTSNSTLFNRDKMLDNRDLLLEFEGGSLTTPALELSYQVLITDTQTKQVIPRQFPRGSIGAASSGKFELKDLDYRSYELSLIVEDPLGKRDEYSQQFKVQASPQIQRVGLSARPDERPETDLPTAIALPSAKSYMLDLQIQDLDSTDSVFTIAYRWIMNGASQQEPQQQILVERQPLPDGHYAGEIPYTGQSDKASTFEVTVIDSDNNQKVHQIAVSFEVPRPLWIVIPTYALGALTAIGLVFSGLMRYTGLPAGVLARQGINVFTVGLGYRNFHKLWASRAPLEQLLLLLAPPDRPFRPSDLHEKLDELETPIDETQVERALEMLCQLQFVDRTGEVYEVTEPAQVSALQNHQGTSSITALTGQIRSENPLYAEALRFLKAAGFDPQPISGLLAFLSAPSLPSWQKTFERPVYTRIFPGAAIDHRSVIQAAEEAQKRAECNQEVIFIVVNQTPGDSAWLQIGTLRAENVQIVPIDDALIQSGREQQKEHQALQFHLRRFLGRRRDLYNVRDPVADRLNFFGREAQAGELLEIISEGHPVLMLALRKMGKSSLLLYLRDKAPFPVAHVDLQAGSEPAGLYARMIESLQRSLRVKYPELSWDPPEISRMQGSEPSKVADAFAEAVRDLMAVIENAGHASQVGLFIDEIEVIVPLEPEGALRPDPDTLERYLVFARMLRGLLQETGQLALLGVGVDPRLNHINRWAAEQNPFYQFFREEYLGPLSRPDCIQMVRNIGQQMGLAYTEDALEFIADLSGGHPFLARQLCSLAVRDLGEDQSSALALENMQAAAQRFVRDPNTESLLNERGMWGEVTNPELWSELQIIENQIILTDLAENEVLPEEQLLQSGRDPVARERSLFDLKQRYVLNKVMAALHIQFGLFRSWIQRYRANSQG